MMATAGNNMDEITAAVCNVVNDHLRTSGIKAEELPQSEVELLILNMRAKSVGEKIELIITDPETDKNYPTNINLSQVKIVEDKAFKSDITLSDERILSLKLPGIKSMDGIEMTEGNEFDSTIDILVRCFKTVVDGDEVYARGDVDDATIKEFFLDLESGDFQKITDSFFNRMPKLQAKVKAKREDGSTLEVLVEGLASFL